MLTPEPTVLDSQFPDLPVMTLAAGDNLNKLLRASMKDLPELDLGEAKPGKKLRRRRKGQEAAELPEPLMMPESQLMPLPVCKPKQKGHPSHTQLPKTL